MLKDFFSEEPFRCRCCSLDAFDPVLRSILNQAREKLGQPIIINSGCRCFLQNKTVGGAKHSAHLPGPDGLCHAVDIRCVSDITRAELHRIFYDLGIRRFECSDRHLHVDRADFYLPSPILASVNFRGQRET